MRKPQSECYTRTEECEEELKTPPKTRTASKRNLSTEKEMQETKRSATGSSPMRPEGRFDTLPRAHLEEMEELTEEEHFAREHFAREHEYYAAAEGMEFGEEEYFPDMEDDGSDNSEEDAGRAIDTVRRLEFRDANEEDAG